MEHPWVAEGDKSRCRTHAKVFPVGEVCPSCLAAPIANAASEPNADEKLYTERVKANEKANGDQADRWAAHEQKLLGQAARCRNADRALSLTRAAALAADVARKARAESSADAKVLARVGKVQNQRRERLNLRKGRSH